MSAHLVLDVTSPATLAFELAVSTQYAVTEALTVSTDGSFVAAPGGRRPPRDPPARPRGRASAGCCSTTPRRSTGAPSAEPTDEADLLRYLRPSRYCESDSLGPTAHAEFAGLHGYDLLAAVSSWVGSRLSYVPGSSLPTDGAVRTLLARQGVCRDYAHLVVALLRALDVPARLVSVYAPGLQPMDFHAVAEAYLDGQWYVVDATTLAPRSTLVRIATGRDASDTAFLNVHHGFADLLELEVTAVAGTLPDDDVRDLVVIG